VSFAGNVAAKNTANNGTVDSHSTIMNIAGTVEFNVNHTAPAPEYWHA
jgi:hypothetical protein